MKKKEQVLDLTPEPGAKIERIAKFAVKLMKQHNLPAQINFEQFTMEVPKDATEEDIVRTYKEVASTYLPDKPKFNFGRGGPKGPSFF